MASEKELYKKAFFLQLPQIGGHSYRLVTLRRPPSSLKQPASDTEEQTVPPEKKPRRDGEKEKRGDAEGKEEEK